MLAVHALCGAGSMLGIMCTTVLHAQLVAWWQGIITELAIDQNTGIEMNTDMQDRLLA